MLNNQGELMSFDAHKMPVFQIIRNQEWVSWGHDLHFQYGDVNFNNNQPAYYDWLRNSSSKHRAILETKTRYITGKGWGINPKGLDRAEVVENKAFIAKLEDSEWTGDTTKDWTEYGGFCYEMIPDKGFKKAVQHWVNFGNVRRSVPEYEDNGLLKPTRYFFTNDWTVRKPQENPDWAEFEAFPWDLSELDKNKRYLVYVTDDKNELYPLPEYTAAVPYIAADYEVGNFVFNNTKSGFSASYLVNFFNGEPTEEQKRQVEQAWKKSKHGSDNAGEPILSFNENKDSGVEVTALPSNGQDDRYINLNKQIRDEIFAGHTINPLVANLPNESGGFSNNADEDRVAVEKFQSNYVDPKQIVLERHINAIKTLNQLKGMLFIERLDPPQSEITETELAAILTVDERRARAGFPVSEAESNPVANALATISPLVATKVLEAMSLAEIRGIVGLETNGPIERRTETLTTEFSQEEDDIILAHFEGCGIDDSTLRVIKSFELEAFSIEEAISKSKSFEFITVLENTILTLIAADMSIMVSRLAELTGESEETIQDILDKLESEGELADGEVTDKGLESIGEGEIFTVYKYVKRRDASGPDVIPGTRPFCKSLIRQSASRSWTIQQIGLLNNGQGLDVFRSRGGWFRLPNGRSRPSCRHVWEARLVTRLKAQPKNRLKRLLEKWQ